MRDDWAGLREFLAVAEHRSFTAAAARLRVTPSAVSQALSGLESRVGIRLVQRTTRSVGLTEAGTRFLAELRPAVDSLGAAFASLDRERTGPTGTLRLSIPRLSVVPVIGPMLAPFLAAHPGVRLELLLDDALVDIVARGFDAGIRLGEIVDRDMIGMALTPPMRMTVVGSPSYFATRPKPRHPRELAEHDCVNYRQISSGNVYRWEFEDKGRAFRVAVDGRVLTNDHDLMLRAALDGVGLAYLMEHAIAGELREGKLERVLTRFSPGFPGLHLYYPNRKHLSPKLRALVDFLRAFTASNRPTPRSTGRSPSASRR